MKPTKAQVEKVAEVIYHKFAMNSWPFSTLNREGRRHYLYFARWLVARGLDPEKVKT